LKEVNHALSELEQLFSTGNTGSKVVEAEFVSGGLLPRRILLESGG